MTTESEEEAGPATSVPRRLADPLWRLRIPLRILWVLVLIRVGMGLFMPNLGETPPGAVVDEIFFAASAVFTACAVAVLPARRTNAIYLRSFRTDVGTAAVRGAVQEALGPEFRLSGIRDPRRRWGGLLRHLYYLIFIFRYASHRYMNLEAGADWRRRLWRSLGDCRCAVLDLRAMSPFVEEEVRLAVERLGVERVLFVVDDAREFAEWARRVREVAGLPDGARPWLAAWGGRAGLREFTSAVRSFRAALPGPPARHETRPCPAGAAGAAFDDGDTRRWVAEGRAAFWVAQLVSLALLIATTAAVALIPGVKSLAIASGVVVCAIQLACFIAYLVDCTSNRRRAGLVARFLLIGFVSSIPALVDWGRPRVGAVNLAARVLSEQRLKHIGQALYLRASGDRGRPSADAITGRDGRRLLSWRVMILPELGEDGLFEQFHLDEAWDSPWNARLLDKMPAVYATAYRPETRAHPATTTHYLRVTVRGEPAKGVDPFASGSRSAVVVESSRAVPWTKPEDLEFDPADARAFAPMLGVPRLISETRGIPAVFSDGAVETLPPRPQLTPERLSEAFRGGPKRD